MGASLHHSTVIHQNFFLCREYTYLHLTTSLKIIIIHRKKHEIRTPFSTQHIKICVELLHPSFTQKGVMSAEWFASDLTN